MAHVFSFTLNRIPANASIRLTRESSDLSHGLRGRVVVVHHTLLVLRRILSVAVHLSMSTKRVRGFTIFSGEY